MAKTSIPTRPISFSDSFTNLARNDQPAKGVVSQLIAQAVQSVQHRGRPLFHFWGGSIPHTTSPADASGDITFEIARFSALDGGCKSERGVVLAIPGAGDLGTGDGVSLAGNLSPCAFGGTGTSYPDKIHTINLRPSAADTDPAIAPGYPEQQLVTAHTVLPMSGCVYEDSVEQIVDISTSVATLGFGSGRDILATQTGNYGTLEQLQERFTHVWMNRRPVIQWATHKKLDSTFDQYVSCGFSTDCAYLFDPTVGDSGTAPSATGPAITLPLRYAAAGLSTQVRVYVWVLAAMSGITDGGSINVANKDVSGTMTAFRPLTNPQTIGGTGFAWYPSLGSFNPATAPYFLGNASDKFDRVLLGGKSSGGTDEVRIQSWMMAVYPSEA